jgi:DNA adenine methylase
MLRKYDRPYTFFYLDPPYFNKPYYKFNFTEQDYIELADRLKALKGKFLLSLNDTPEIRRIFSSFNISTVELVYTARLNAGKRYTELLISNYQLPNADSIKASRQPLRSASKTA